MRLRDGAEIGSGKSPRYTNGGTQTFDVIGSNGKIGSTDKVNFQSGIAVGRVGASGSVHHIKTPVWLSDNVLYVKPNPTIWNESFLYHTLTQARLPALASQTAQPILTQSDLGAIILPVPSLTQQNSIVEKLNSFNEAHRATEELIFKTEKLRESLIHELLTRGLPGQHTEWKEVPSIGTIPATWQVVRLDDIADIIGGSTPSRKVEEYWGSDIPWVVPSELTKMKGKYLTSTRESITVAGLRSSSLKIIPPMSVLLTTRATIGTAAINLIPVTTNQGFQNLVPKIETDTLWLYYYMLFSKRLLVRRASGSTFLELSRKSVLSMNIALPSIQEQTIIGNQIDSIDNVLENYRKEHKMLKIISRTLSNILLTGKSR